MASVSQVAGCQRPIADVAISAARASWYAVSEPLRLAAARRRYAADYADPGETPLVSAYVPTYNRAELLVERALSSMLAQTYENIEIVVIGDCCTDDTAERVAALNDRRVRFHNIPKRTRRYPESAENHWLAGPVVAANTALRMLSGKWIARNDDDDIWTPDHVEVLLRHAQRRDLEFVSGAYECERDGRRHVCSPADEVPPIGGTQTWLYRSYLKFFRYNIDCWRKSWNRVNDTDIQDRFHKAGVRMGYVDRVVCRVLPRPGEETIGLDAYRRNEAAKLAHFGFQI